MGKSSRKKRKRKMKAIWENVMRNVRSDVKLGEQVPLSFDELVALLDKLCPEKTKEEICNGQQ